MFQANQEKVIRLSNAAAAATTDVTSSVLDTAGFEGAKLYTLLGAITTNAVTSVKVQQSDDDGVADAYSDLEASGSVVADDDDNQIVVHDIFRPQKRYLKVVVDRGTQNAVVDGIFAVLYGAKKLPTTDDSATVVSRNCLASPDEGTA